jgi:hypothetical protein
MLTDFSEKKKFKKKTVQKISIPPHCSLKISVEGC